MMDTNEAMALSEAGTSSWVQADQVVAVLAAEVRRLREIEERARGLEIDRELAPDAYQLVQWILGED